MAEVNEKFRKHGGQCPPYENSVCLGELLVNRDRHDVLFVRLY